MPVPALPAYTRPPTHQIKIRPAAAHDLRAPQPRTFHQQDCRPLVRKRRRPQPRELRDARPIDVGLPLWRTPDPPRGIAVDHVFGLRTREEVAQHRDDVRPRGGAAIAPAPQEYPEILRRQFIHPRLRKVRSELPEDSAIRIDRARGRIPLKLPPVEERVDCQFYPHNPTVGQSYDYVSSAADRAAYPLAIRVHVVERDVDPLRKVSHFLLIAAKCPKLGSLEEWVDRLPR